jgi:hypothetical protein
MSVLDQALAKLGTLDLESSCGDEPPRQAIIGVQIRWTGAGLMLRPAFRVMPTRFLDGCEMTIAISM